MRKLRIAIDYDDVLALCSEYAINIENEKRPPEDQLDYNSIDKWGPLGKPTDVIFKHFEDENFYKTQPLYEGAQEFVKTLLDLGCDVVILTAIDQKFASIRHNKILKEFPMLNKNNIILTSRKDLVQTDILVDDAPHNLADTSARYPICFRRPWNMDLTGLISAFEYDEIINFVKQILMLNNIKSNENKIYCLVAPSGSGKTAIAQELAKDPTYKIPRSTTTRARREGESETAYNFVSKEEFEKLYVTGHFIETTVYAGNRYGTTRDELDDILESGKNAVLPIDFTGTNALKMKYGDKCVTVYVKRSKPLVVSALLDRLQGQLLAHPENAENIKNDIMNRILSLNTERKNEDLCDRVIVNNGTIAEAIKGFY